MRRASKTSKKKRVQPGELPPLVDPDHCPVCAKPFALVVGCHKVCECGYMEGCGD